MADQWGMNDAIVKTSSTPDFGANDEIDQHSPLRRGWNKMKQSVGLTTDLTTGNYKGAAEGVAEADTYQRQNPGSPEGKAMMQAWQRGDGISGGLEEVGKQFSKDWNAAPTGLGAIRSVAKNVQAMGSGVLEQTPNMIAPMGAQLAGGALGAVAGSKVPVVGTAIGGLAGMWAGASLGNAAVEGGGMAQEALQSAGVNPQDKAATEAYLSQNGDKLLEQAGVKGGIIGAIDTLTMRLGHGLLTGPAKAASERAIKELGIDVADKEAVKAATGQIAAKVIADPVYKAATSGAGGMARNVGVAALEPAGEFAGEYAGQGVATGNWDEKNAFLEAASSIGQGAATFAGQKLYANAKNQFGKADPVVSPTEAPQVTPEADPNGLALAPYDQTGPKAQDELAAFPGGMLNLKKTFNPKDPNSQPPLSLMPTDSPDGIDFKPDQTFTDPVTGMETTLFDGGMERTYPTAPKPSEAMGLTPTAAPSLTNAAILAVDSGVSQPAIGQMPVESDADQVKSAQDEYRAQTAAMLQKQDEQAYQAYMDAIEQSKVATDEAPGETIAAVAPIASALGDFDHLSDDEFFAALGATPQEIQDAVTSQPSSPQASAANPSGVTPDVVTSPIQSAPAADAKQTNLERIRAASRKQPTALGTQTNAVAGPGFSAKDVISASNQPVAPVQQAQVATENVATEKQISNPLPEPKWWTDKSEGEQLLLKKVHGFNNEDASWSAMTDDQQKQVADNYAEFESGNAKFDPAGIPALFGIKGQPKKRGEQAANTVARQERIDSTLKNGGHVVGNKLRMSNGMTQMILTDDELSAIPDSSKRAAPNPDDARIKPSGMPAAPTGAPMGVTPVAQPAQPVTREGAGGSQPTQVALPKPKTASKAGLDHLFGVDQKRAKAIERIANGAAYFSKPLKAQEFIAKNGLKDTHKSVKTSPNRWDIVSKSSQPTEKPSAQATKTQQVQAERPPQGTTAATTDKPAADAGVAAAGQAEVAKKPVTPQLPPDGKMPEAEGVWVSTGRSDFKDGKPRVLPSYFTKPGDKNSKDWYRGWDAANAAKPVAEKPQIVTNKAEMRPYRKPDGSVGYEAVPIQAETPVEPRATKAETLRELAKINEQMPDGFEAADGPLGVGLFQNGKPVENVQGLSRVNGYGELLRQANLRTVNPTAKDTGQNDELDAEMRSYEAKKNPTYSGEPDAPVAKTPTKPDPLTDKEKAAKAKMFNALGKLAALAGKNTKMNWTQEEEQQILPIVIELFDGAMDLGAVTFQKAVRYVREFIAGGIDQETADSIPFETLQGAYIATSGRHKDKAVTPKREVAAFDSLEELENSAEKADTDPKDTQNATRQLDSTGESPLEGTPANAVQGTAAVGPAAASPSGRSGPDAEGNRGADGSGVPILGSLGDGAGGLPVPARGSRGKRGSAKQSGVSGNAPVPQGNGSVDTTGGTGELIPVNPAPNAAPIAAPAFDPQDFTIEDDFALGEGGAKAKFKGNVAAIWLIAQLDTEQRAATPTEQRVLAAYVGWGGLAQAFDANNSDWTKEYAELKGLMSEDDYADARLSTRYAHYTSREIIQDGIYAALRHFGFNGGRALEGGAGVGNFIGLMPADMRSASRFTAIEREPFSAKIARHLYPKQNIQEADFTQFIGNDDFYDVAVGNPPFASDPQVDQSGRKHLSGLSLHNYFFAKAVDMLREGGILAQVVTNSFMDANTDTARAYISEKTKFLGAIRLPNNAFSKNAGTEVTTDLIFLQKRPESEWGGKAAKADAKQWLNVGKFVDAEGRTVALNQYFIDHPDMMLGKFGAYGTMYRGESPALVQKPGQDTGALLKDAVSRLPGAVYVDKAITNTANMQDAFIKTLSQPSVQEGGYFVEDGKLFQRIKDIAGEARGKEITPETMWTAKTKLGTAGFARIQSLSAMRETVRSLLAAELSNDPKMAALRKTLNEQYDAYDKEHGRINDPGTLRVFDDDPDFPLLASLEYGYTPAIGLAAARSMGIKPVPSKATKGPIFTQRVIDARQQVAKVETPADALAVSMAERGKLDTAYIGELLGREADDVLRELSSGDKPLLFKDPATGEYALRDAYLSGNVRAKLVQAKQAGMFNNIKALEEVQPADVGSHQINARIGSPWVPESVYVDFASKLFGDGTAASIRYVKETAGFGAYITAGNSTANTNTWGTTDYPGTDILAALLNNKPIKVTYKDADGNIRTHTEATEKANIKAQEIRDKFQDWLFADAERSEILGRAYNDTNNNYVTREFDGEWMTFPGKVPNAIVKFRRHQRNAIARIVQDRTALLDHVVGSGKTYTIIASAMELRRTGLARKPMIAVPNHLVKQWAADFYKLYPGANILTATKKDFEKTNRRKFLAKIATGDWDAVIIAHSSFGFIKPATDFEHRFNSEQVANIVKTINEVERGDGDKMQKKRTVKQLEGIKERLENRIKALRDKPMDALLDFGEIGVDQLFVDEAHMFKNLMFTTKMQNIAGLGDSTGSQRACDMYVKANQIYSQNGRGQGVVFATGTPVSNSLAEMYHMMRYLMPAQMKEMGFESFDAWANTFASVEQVWMQKASGDGFKAQNRMSNFVNTTELLKVFDQVSDTVTMDDIKKAFSEENNGAEFPLPKLKGGKRTPVSLVKSVGQNAYMADIANRALKLEQRKGPPQKGEDNILVIMSDARKAAMDIRLVDPTVTEREKGGRIDKASQEIVSRYQQYNAVKGTQIVFSDLGTPLKSAKKELAEYQALIERIQEGSSEVMMQRASMGDEAAQEKIDDAEDAQNELDAKGKDWLGAVQAAERGFSVYDDLKLALMEQGIPENEIAFIHDYNTDEQKAGLFRKMNAGQIRVLMGSTPKLGAGTNVQERLVALHHLDVPWKPSDVEQREGRIIRQGNKLDTQIPGFEVEVLAYVTQDTLDMRMWQVQETKLKMINQLRTRKIDRDIENAFEDLELSAGEMQAAATGNMDLLREIQIKGELKKLEQRKRAFDAQKSDLQNRKKSNAQRLASLPEKIESSKAMADATDQYKQAVADQEAKFTVTIDGKEYTNAKDAGNLLRGMVDAHVYMQRQADGKFGGRQLTLEQMQQEPVQDPKADDYNPWTKRPVPLSVDVNGVHYTSRDKLLEAYANIRGDNEAIAWTLDGKTLNRRSQIEIGISKIVADSIAEQEVRDIGSLGPLKVSVEGQDNNTYTVVEIVLRHAGQEISNTMMGGLKEAKDSEATTTLMCKAIVRSAENMALGARQQHEYEKRQLQQALKEKAELDATEMQGEWPDQGKLEDLRKKHQEVLRRLSGAKAAESAKSLLPLKPERMPPLSGMFKTSRVGTSSPMKLSLDAVKKSVQSALKRIPNAPRIEVHPNPGSVGIVPPDGVVPKGVTLNDGSIIVFSDAAESVLDVFQTVFHELFHRGSKVRFASNSDYIKTMLDIAASDSMVRAAASQWKVTKDGQAKLAEFSAKGPMTGDRLANFEALAVEEALAEMGERFADGHVAKKMMMRRIAAFLSRVTKAWGMDGLSRWLGNEKLSVTETFIRETINMSGGTPNMFSTALLFKSGGIGNTLSSAANNVRNVKLPADYVVGDFFNSAPGKLGWWHKTVGTQYHLAQKSPAFKRVFDSVQTFLNDVSYYATEAADMAPNILPKLETWKDIAKKPVSAEDTKAFSRPVFEGTLTWGRDESGKPVRQAVLEGQAAKLTTEQKGQRLLRGNHISQGVLKMWQGLPIDQYEAMIEGKYERDMLKPGIVFTPAELKQLFNLTPNQIKLYQEFRSATDRSLTNLAIADMLRFGGDDVFPIREAVLESVNVQQAAETLSKYLLSLTDIDPARTEVLTDTANKMIDKGDKAKDLMDRGYAPLSRFGQYTLDVVDASGERVYFGMFESKWEAARMNRQMREAYPDAKINQGTVSEQAYKMFAGVSPETLALFGDMLGLEQQGDGASAQAFQEYLKLAKSNRSAMKRLIQRKGIAGFNEDAGRVLAGFVYSNARQTSTSLHMGEMTNATNDMPKHQGELKDAAVKLVDYIKNPQEEAQAIRGLMFTQFIGGSIASAMVNLTQPITMTLPWLTQYGGAGSAAKTMASAIKDAYKKTTGDAKLDAALKLAEEKGIVSPQEVHQLQQQAQGRAALRSGDGTKIGDASAAAQNSLSRFMLAWGKPFSWAEQMNRRVTFIAAYRTALAQKMADPMAFAEKAINETQGIYNKGNKPVFGRGAMGGMLMIFKQFSISYVEMLQRMYTSGPEGKKAALLALGILFLMSGMSGLPGSDDLDDVISGTLQSFGYNFDSKQKRKEFFVGLMGEDAARFVERGISGLPGAPIDVAGRMGLGNLIPGTGLFQKKLDHTRDLAELIGPVGSFAKQAYDAAGKAISGEILGARGAVSTIAPKAAQNLFQAWEMESTDMYKDSKGNKVISTDSQDALVKALGFQPNDVARAQDANFDVQRMKGLNIMRESEIADQWAKGLFEKDDAKVKDARAELAQWNADNPESPIRINFKQIMNRVHNMNLTKAERIIKTTPKEIRAAVKRELAAQ